jgi:hypothetical protein
MIHNKNNTCDEIHTLISSTQAYVVYLFLIGTQLFNTVATILLYALMCCIYAALLGVVLFYCPRLISLLQPILFAKPQPDEQQQSPEHQPMSQPPPAQQQDLKLQQQKQSISSDAQTTASCGSSTCSGFTRTSKTRNKTGPALAMRLIVVTIVCIGVFLAHTISYARLVVMPPQRVYWWWSYGRFN